MLPEVEKYFADMKVVQEATDAAMEEVAANHPIPTPPQWGTGGDWTEYDRAAELRRVPEIEVYNRAENGRSKARAALLETTSDPLVKWIAQSVLGSHRDHSEQILKELTSDTSNRYTELSDFANGRGWCNVFSQFRTAAVRAGVLDDTRTPLDRLRAYVADERDKAVAEAMAARAANPFQDPTTGEDA